VTPYQLPIGSAAPLELLPRWYRSIVVAQARLTSAHPALGIAVSESLGWLANRLALYGIRPEQLHEFFPDLDAVRRAQLARRITAREMRNRALDRLAERDGFQRVLPLAREEGLREILGRSARRQPAVLGTFHLGPLIAISATLKRLEVPALLIRAGPGIPVPPPLEVAELEDEDAGPAVLKRALARLDAGGIVVVALDGGVGSRTGGVACLGRLLRLGRGALTLVRMSGAPLIPVIARWQEKPRLPFVQAFEPLPTPAWQVEGAAAAEERLAEVVAAWLEQYLRANPDQISMLMWMMLLEAPPIVPPTSRGA
jgi:hypothetical protein